MGKLQAIFVADLIESILRDTYGPFVEARKRFAESHGTYGLRKLFEAEQFLRNDYQIPDSTGNIIIQD